MGARALLELNAGTPAALGQKRLRVGHFQDFAKSPRNLLVHAGSKI